MREYPLVRVSREPARQARLPGKSRYIPPRKLPYSKQLARLGERFESAVASVESFTTNVQVAADPRAVIPERALVLEIIGTVDKFDQAVQALGLEWMGSQHADESDDEEDPEAPSDDQPRAKYFYLTMPSERGLRTLLAAWKRFSSNKPATSKEEKRLWDIFGYLADFRTWSVQDRIDPSLVRYVNALLKSRPNEMVSVEVDLWYRTERQDGISLSRNSGHSQRSMEASSLT